jgi:hypothetical protein
MDWGGMRRRSFAGGRGLTGENRLHNRDAPRVYFSTVAEIKGKESVNAPLAGLPSSAGTAHLLSVEEEFVRQHPAIDATSLLRLARVILAKYHKSPASFKIEHDGRSHQAEVAFHTPDPTTKDTFAQKEFTEKGAIVMAGLALSCFEQKQITKVVQIGDKVDYFVGEHPGDSRWIMEVSGIAEGGSLKSLKAQKIQQLKQSRFHRPPHSKPGFVSVSRFEPDAVTVLDTVAPQRNKEQ